MTGNSFHVSGYGPDKAGWTRLFARDSMARRLDWPILLAAVALSLMGSLLVYPRPATAPNSTRATSTTSSPGTC